MKILVTGADGFLGWHTRLRLKALHPDVEVAGVRKDDWAELPVRAEGADVILHLAGVNRAATDDDVYVGNVTLAKDLADVAPAVPIVYANSVHAGGQTAYGTGKLAAADILAAACRQRGKPFTDVRLPNLFGEHGRPKYNSFVATFVDAVIKGEEPESFADRPIELLHAQQAAQVLIDALDDDGGRVQPDGYETSVGAVWETLKRFHATYAETGDIPDLTDAFELALFNTYRSALVPDRYPIRLSPKTDERGWLVETVRNHGSGGQTFVSTTVPGAVRGEHFHLRKVERFVVLDGEARIEMRRELTDDVLTYDVSGEEPVAIDMPMGWTHNLTATGETAVTTFFWTSELFDPDDPDTYDEAVRP